MLALFSTKKSETVNVKKVSTLQDVLILLR